MINIRLKEREEALLSRLKESDTFKIPESSFVFMKVDVDGLTVRPKTLVAAEPGAKPEPIRVLIPEGKTVVVCLNTGKAQFLNSKETVQIVELECIEIAKEKRPPQQLKRVVVRTELLGGSKDVDLGGEGRVDESPSFQ